MNLKLVKMFRVIGKYETNDKVVKELSVFLTNSSVNNWFKRVSNENKIYGGN